MHGRSNERDQRPTGDDVRRSAEWLGAILAANPVPVGVSRVEDGLILYANPACLELFGYEEHEFVGHTGAELGIWLDPEHRAEILRRLETDGRVGDLQTSIRGKGGREFEVLLSMNAVDLGGEASLIVLLHDITERARADRELQALSHRLDSILQATGDGIFGVDAEGRCTFVNAAAAAALGYGPEELVGRVVPDLIGDHGRGGTTRPPAPWPAVGAVETGRVCRADDEVLRRRDGSRFPVELTAWPISEQGDGVTGAVVVFRDVSERRRTEEVIERQLGALREQAALLDLTQDAILVRDREGRISFWNKGAERTYGWTRDEAIGQQVNLLLRTEYPEPPEAINAAVERDGEWAGRLVHRTRDGRRIVVASRWALVRDADGRPQAVLGINTDITAQAEAEQARDAARQDAERANRAKTEFLSRMSHELRTPLNAILGFAQLLELDELRPDQREAVDHIAGAGRHLLELIDEVLDISRIEVGRLKLSLEAVRLHDAVSEVMAMVAPIAAARSVTLSDETGKADGGDLYVRADRQRLKQVLLNLVSNAVKYNREHGVVRVRCHAAGGGRTRVVVDDTGIGIPDHDLERLFVPFERLASGESMAEGTGLGLALSKRLAETMGGAVGVRSEVGRGSSFWVELGGAVAPAPHASLAPSATAPVAPAAAGAGAGTVLYVEDNLANVRLVERILARRPEVNLVVAMQASIGLELARQHRPTLVLLDLNLPDMPGEEALRRLRADPRTADIPVAVVSADATPGQVERLRASGADEYLTKPFDVARLLAVVDGVAGVAAAEGPSSEPGGAPLDPAVVAQLREVAGHGVDGEDPFADVVETFLECAWAEVPELEASVRAGDAEAARTRAHKLAGGSASLGAHLVAALCRAIEAEAAAGELSTAPELVARLEETLAEAEAALRAEFLAAGGAAGGGDVRLPSAEASRGRRDDEHALARVRALLERPDALRIVFQPVVDAFEGTVLGVEALSRFALEPAASPDLWLRDAGAAGLRTELELLALRRAAESLDDVPGHLAVNVSADVLASPGFSEFVGLLGHEARRLVIELTDHPEVAGDDELLAVVARCRAAGIRFAVDDDSGGPAGFRRLLRLAPDFIKLDRSLVAGIDRDPALRAEATAVADFAADIGAAVVAEGVERVEELRVLRTTGVRIVQGYLTGRPSSLPLEVPELEPPKAGGRAVVVDGDPVVRPLVARVLRRNGFEVVGQAVDAGEGAALADALAPDVIVLGRCAPLGDATRAVPRLRHSVPDARIIVLSASSDARGDAGSHDLGGRVDAVVDRTAVASQLPEALTSLG